MSEAYAVQITHRKGRRLAARAALQFPFDLATGKLERLSDLAIRECIKDLQAEQERRTNGNRPVDHEPEQHAAEATTKYDPFASQIRGGRTA